MQLKLMNYNLFSPGLFRLMLSFLVVLSHLSNWEVGKPAVMAFFILSGYWVSKMYSEKYVNNTFVFFISRFLRIWPLYMAVTIVTILAYYFILDTSYDIYFSDLFIISAATYSSNYQSVSWSLDVELQFYIFIPLILSFIRMHVSKMFFIVLLLFALAYIVNEMFGVVMFLYYIVPFVSGILLYKYKYKYIFCFYWASASLIAFLLFGVVIFNSEDFSIFLFKDSPVFISEDIFGMIWVSMLIPFIGYNVTVKSTVFDRHLGNYSYSLYLVHWPVIFSMKSNGQYDFSIIEILGAVIFFGLLFYNFIEIPIEKFRVKYVNKLILRV